MSTPVMVVGHKNPDNDSISSAVGYAYLKNQLELRRAQAAGQEPAFEYLPVRLGPLPPETEWVLSENGLPTPQVIAHVHPRVKDAMTPNPITIDKDATVLEAGRILRQHNLRALVVTGQDGKYFGLVTTRMIAERYIAATDAAGDDQSNKAVVDSLIQSLSQKVAELSEPDVLILDEEGLLSEAVEDLMAHVLREAVVLDDDGYCIGIVTRSDIASHPKRNVVLVDHNESSQAANGIEEANVMEIVDHHRIGDISTASPIQFLNIPVGSTATIITGEYRKNSIDIPKDIAAVLLSAIMTDTVILKSPTATDVDRDQVDYLSSILGIDATDFGLQVFRCRGGEKDMPLEELVGADAKEFQVGDATLLIAQHETVDLQTVLDREDEIRAYMANLQKDHGYEFVLLLVTDIMAEGSQFIVEGNHRMVDRVFGIDSAAGSCWIPGILSRKKQVAARILGA